MAELAILINVKEEDLDWSGCTVQPDRETTEFWGVPTTEIKYDVELYVTFHGYEVEFSDYALAQEYYLERYLNERFE